jgi:thiosulfate/3-mercaptopyruvate sulfurtransferase
MMQPMFKNFVYFSIIVFYLLSPIMAGAASVLIDVNALQAKMLNRHTHILEVETKHSKPHTEHIPRAFSTQYERDGWLNTVSELAGAMPSKARLAQVIGTHGMDKHSDIILVNMNNDRYSLAATLRIYWLVKFAGLEQVSILKGGFARYRNQQAPLGTRITSPVRKKYSANFQELLLSSTSSVESALYTTTLLLDFRSTAYYEGEKRSEHSLRFGSIPNADNIPWQDLASSQGQLYDFKQLRNAFSHIPKDKDSPIICFGEISHHAIIGWFVLCYCFHLTSSCSNCCRLI